MTITAYIMLVVRLKFEQLIFEAFIRFNNLTTGLNIVISLVIAHIPLLHQEHDHNACGSRNSKSTMDQYSVLMMAEGLENKVEGLLKVCVDIVAFYVGDISVHIPNVRFKSVFNSLTRVYDMCNLQSVYNIIAL